MDAQPKSLVAFPILPNYSSLSIFLSLGDLGYGHCYNAYLLHAIYFLDLIERDYSNSEPWPVKYVFCGDKTI